jgi:hypothetical protein
LTRKDAVRDKNQEINKECLITRWKTIHQMYRACSIIVKHRETRAPDMGKRELLDIKAGYSLTWGNESF